MIVAQRKSIPELVEILDGNQKILVLGCGTCVAVCLAGGRARGEYYIFGIAHCINCSGS